jgi:hypothetical protein
MRLWRFLLETSVAYDSWKWRWYRTGWNNWISKREVRRTSGMRGLVGKIFCKLVLIRRIGDGVLLEVLINFFLYSIYIIMKI